mmetsp:Transcript_85201/g.170229  ORF Transcript_85201/g.170229 Transcript_85201/m.170229 type:complete len:235 (+) Transcript_85201:189-893(+)
MTVCKSSRMRCARPLCWKGTLIDLRSRKKTASKQCIAHVQRSGLKSSGFFSPIGKLSSARSGWSSKSTSSMIKTPERKMPSTFESARTSRSKSGCCWRQGLRSTSIFSRSLSCNDLMVAAVHRTTPRLCAAVVSLSTVDHFISEERSKKRVKTRLRTMEEKVARSVALDCSRSAGGIVCTTSLSPSPSISVKRGPTTVVFPPPMSICLTNGLPDCTAAINSRTSCTCALRKIRL